MKPGEAFLENNGEYMRTSRKAEKWGKRKAYHKAYYVANRERLSEKRKAYREANREQRKAYREANRERISERMKAYYAANREQRKANSKVYYVANRERLLEQRKESHAAIREQARLIIQPEEHWSCTWAHLGGCGDDYEFDHIEPVRRRTKSGYASASKSLRRWIIKNPTHPKLLGLQILCNTHNAFKGDRDNEAAQALWIKKFNP